MVILEETWLTETNQSHVCLPGYNYYGKSHPNRKGGGVGFLINNRLSYKARPDLEIKSNTVEHCFIEIRGKKYGIIVGLKQGNDK